ENEQEADSASEDGVEDEETSDVTKEDEEEDSEVSEDSEDETEGTEDTSDGNSESESSSTNEEEDASDESIEEGNETDEEEANEADDKVEADEESELEIQATADEDLNLNEVYGSASGEITYDIEKGYYTLDLRAGFSNYTSSQDIKGKWVTFTLPDGVNVADDLPNGVTSVYIAGKTGIAVKVPDIEGIGSETVQKQIPLTGEDTDNDPVYNLYMVDVDVDAGQYEEIGQVNA